VTATLTNGEFKNPINNSSAASSRVNFFVYFSGSDVMTQLQTPNRQQRPSRPCASTGGLSGGVPGGAPAGTSAAEAAASVPLVPTNNNHPGTANHNCPGPPVPKMSKGKETLFCSIQETAVSIKQSFIT